MYFTTLFNLAKKIPAEPAAAVSEGQPDAGEGRQTIKVPPFKGICCKHNYLNMLMVAEAFTCAKWVPKYADMLQVLEAATGIALSSCICYVGQQLAVAMGYPSASISVITIITVLLATCMPMRLAPLVPSSEGIAYILLQVRLCHAPHCSAMLHLALLAQARNITSHAVHERCSCCNVPLSRAPHRYPVREAWAKYKCRSTDQQ